jgi:hypothetical protein
MVTREVQDKCVKNGVIFRTFLGEENYQNYGDLTNTSEVYP